MAQAGGSEATIYTWISKYGGFDVGEAQRLKNLEDENRRLSHLVPDLSLDKGVLGTPYLFATLPIHLQPN